MEKPQISTTAMGIAALRALESQKPPGQRICYDPLARQFVSPAFYLFCKIFAGYGERVGPGTQGFLVCRCRYFDDYLQERLRSGTAQVVILGAGLDSRAYRPPLLPGAARTFEVDRPGTIAGKRELVKKVLGEIPPHVTYVPLDFNKETLDKLLSFGLEKPLQTLFLLEGVTYYLEPESVDATLAWVRGNTAPGSAIIFDYVSAAALSAQHRRGEIRRMQRYRGLTGEHLAFGIEKGKIESFLSQRGFVHVVDADAQTLHRLYCTGPNQGRKVGEIYAIVHAEVGKGRA